MVETCFKTLKSELVWRTFFPTRARAQAENVIARYINGFYKLIQRHSTRDRPNSKTGHTF